MTTSTAIHLAPQVVLQEPKPTPTDPISCDDGKALSSPPFDIETTLTFEAIEYWAKVDPDRTALISTHNQWKVEHGTLTEKHSVSDPKEWTSVTFAEFWDKVRRTRTALHRAGVPRPKAGQKPFRLLLLFAPNDRADVLALLIALQAAGCVLLFASPDGFGGIRPFLETMLTLEPDAVICNKMVYGIFRAICMTLPSCKKRPTWIKSSVLTKLAPKITPKEMEQYTDDDGKSGVTLDSITAVMFSSGTTGPPSPIEISQRMLSFQAAGYAQLLEKHFGRGIITSQQHNPTATGMVGKDGVLSCKTGGPWLSSHIFVNFVMLDLVLGGTAIMQPMGISHPDKTVDAATLLTIWDHFQTNVTSAPPALWKRLLKLQQQQKHTNTKLPVNGLKMAFVGGAETSASFANELATAFFGGQTKESDGCGLYRLYGTTQVLPIALASDWDIRQEESAQQMCARGYGVCLGTKVDGLEVVIDTEVWERQGGRIELPSPNNNTNKQLQIGELCALGTAVSPSMKIAGGANEIVPTRIFRSGDICYMEPTSKNIYFLGRMAQAVDCGDPLKLVPPVGVEMVCLESRTVDRCAFVGVHRTKCGADMPTLVVQFDQEANKQEVEAACRLIRAALEKSIWAPVLKTNKLSLIVYPKVWPVDCRHSSKTNRSCLRDWAAKADSHKFNSI